MPCKSNNHGLKTIVSCLENSEASRKEIESSLPDHEKAFLIGLHACGDLTNSMISWFCSSEKFKSLAVLSCCYHKMKDDNFPISMKYKKEIKAPLNNHFALRLGMISHKKSLITIFGHKHKIKNFIQKFNIFHKKNFNNLRFWFVFEIKLLILN